MKLDFLGSLEATTEKVRRPVVNPKTNFRGTFISRDYELPYHDVNSPVTKVVKQIMKNVDAGKKTALIFDFDGTLTKPGIPDFSVIPNIPKAVADALDRIANDERFSVSIMTARGHDCLEHVNLSSKIAKYTSNGHVKITNDSFGHTQIELQKVKEQHVEHTEKLIETFRSNPRLKNLIEHEVITFSVGLGSLAISINPNYSKKANQIKDYIRGIIKEDIKAAGWSEWTKWQEKLNLFYISSSLFENESMDKSFGMQILTQDLIDEGFDFRQIVCLGDSPHSDGKMMSEASLWGCVDSIYEAINIGVGKKMKGFEDATDHFNSYKDVYEMILALDARLR